MPFQKICGKNVKPSFVVPTKWDDISDEDEKENDQC